jgi:hypothetical protein
MSLDLDANVGAGLYIVCNNHALNVCVKTSDGKS